MASEEACKGHHFQRLPPKATSRLLFEQVVPCSSFSWFDLDSAPVNTIPREMTKYVRSGQALQNGPCLGIRANAIQMGFCAIKIRKGKGT